MRSFITVPAMLCVLVLIIPACGGEREGRKHMVPGLWQADINDLFDRLEQNHPDPFRLNSSEKFEDARSTLIDSLAVWSNEKVIIELSRILAMAGDAGTAVEKKWLEERFRRLPVSLEYFGSGLRVTSTAPGYEEALGKKLVSIGGATVQEIERAVRPVVSRDNYAGWLVDVPRWISYAEALEVFGFAGDRFTIEAVFSGDDGAELPLTLKSLHPDSTDAANWESATLKKGPATVGERQAVIIDFAEGARPAASIRYLGTPEGEPDTGELIRESMAELSEKGLLRLVLDLRGCSSTSGELAEAFTDEAAAWLASQSGRDIVVLVDRSTLRAGLAAAAGLGELEGATLVGELPGGAPNLASETETFRLPNSGVRVTYATSFHRSVPRLKDSPWLPVDIHVKRLWRDRTAGYDAPLDTALASPPPLPPAAEDHPLKDMMLIPAAEFVMGGPQSDIYAPGRKVFVDSFYIDRYEVTNAEYAEFCEETGKNWPEFWGMDEYRCGPDWPDWPVVGVSLYQARLYAKWAKKRIPTEAEWELAARGGLTGMKYPTGDDLLPTDGNYRVGPWFIGTVPVGCYPPNGYGLYDMSGNVVEWVNDYFHPDYYGESPYKNPTGPEKGYIAVIRGGGWHSGRMCSNVYTRNAIKYSWVDIAVGFRCARDKQSRQE